MQKKIAESDYLNQKYSTQKRISQATKLGKFVNRVDNV